MTQQSIPPESQEPRCDIRLWYREPWPWVLIAIPLLTVIASAVTFWLAVSRPDYLVLEPDEYARVKSELRAATVDKPGPVARAADEADGAR